QYSQHRFEQFAHFRWSAGSADAAGFHDLKLGVGGVGAARDQSTGVTHPLSGRGGDAGNEAHHRLLHVVFCPECCVDFVGAADLADHDHCIGVRIVVEHLEHVDVLQIGRASCRERVE